MVNDVLERIAIIDDYQECSYTERAYEAGEFSITINKNIPNADFFKNRRFVQFGDCDYCIGEISSISESVGSEGKASQLLVIHGYDCRYLFKRRVISNFNNGNSFTISGSGEYCLRELIRSQCGENAEEKRRLPIENVMGAGYGNYCTVSESFTNLYDVLCEIATQSLLQWYIVNDNGNLKLVCDEGVSRISTVIFSKDTDSIESGDITLSNETYCNVAYIGGKGNGENRDIYEGEKIVGDSYLLLTEDEEDRLSIGTNSFLMLSGEPAKGIDRFECYQNESDLTNETEYKGKAENIFSQFGETVTINGTSLAKCPYVYKVDYNVGDTIGIKVADINYSAQILAVTETYSKLSYSIEYELGSPKKTLAQQVESIIKKIRNAEITQNISVSTQFKYYDTYPVIMTEADAKQDKIGFTGAGGNVKLFLNTDGVGVKDYHVYVKNTTGNVTLTTGSQGASNIVLEPGLYATIITVDENGNILRYL